MITPPPNDQRLQDIQALQFRDKPAAESLLLAFVRETFPDLGASSVELRPLAVSLNSFNGFLTLADGGRLFFKTHIEPGSVVAEYYNTTLLAEAGYPIIKPLYASTDYGKQLLIYDMIDSPSVFDVAHAIERGERDDLSALADAQHQADDILLDIYRRTLSWQSAEDAGKAAVHQLFYHRLGSRYAQFYEGKAINLPGKALSWDDICKRRWIINGADYTGTLGEALSRAREVLQPAQEGPQIVGHGDAHNGNVFDMPDGLVYFDPAFGGHHHPLLDLTKPLFHNVFATWMYHPQEVEAALHIDWRDDGTVVTVEHDYRPSACREMFLTSKIDRVCRPLLLDLQKHGWLAADWPTFLMSSLLCCPLLTMNLAERFSPAISLLGLSYAVEMGLRQTTGHHPVLNRIEG